MYLEPSLAASYFLRYDIDTVDVAISFEKPAQKYNCAAQDYV